VIVAAFIWVRSPAPITDQRPTVQTGVGTRSYERGRALFVAKGCIGCHWHEQAAPRGSSYGWAVIIRHDQPYALLHNDVEYRACGYTTLG
jgi:hypothetical protein